MEASRSFYGTMLDPAEKLHMYVVQNTVAL